MSLFEQQQVQPLCETIDYMPEDEFSSELV